MAIVLAYRIGIALVPVAAKLLRNVQTEKLDTYLRVSEYAKRLLSDPSKTDEEIAAVMTRENGYSVYVTTVTGDFEVRRWQLEWSVSGPTLLDEDVRVCTFHQIKLSGSQPVNTWDQADFDASLAGFKTWWDTIKVMYRPEFVLTAVKAYRAGPSVVPPQPPVFESIENVPGLEVNNVHYPPQVALSITEQAGVKRNWGRFYLPAPAVGTAAGSHSTNSGRPATAFITGVINATDTMYEAALTGNRPFVIYRPYLEAGRPHEGDTPLPERPANAQTVEQLQIDDVWDVIRSRRWENPTLRVQRAIGAAQLVVKRNVSTDEGEREPPQPADEPVGE